MERGVVADRLRRLLAALAGGVVEGAAANGLN